MLIIIKILLAYLLMVASIYVINSYITPKKKIITFDNILIVLVLAAIPALIHESTYNIFNSFFNIVIIVLTFKIIFKKNFLETVMDAIYITIITFIANILCSLILAPFMNIQMIRTIWYCEVAANVIVAVLVIIISKLPIFKKMYDKIIRSKNIKGKALEMLFLFFLALGFVFITYNMYKNFGYNYDFLINIVIMGLFIYLFLIYIQERNNYSRLSYEYDEVFKYVKEFENWIEKEQLNRHEFKNQLAVLRIMAKEQAVKDKIDSIISDNIDIDEKHIIELQSFPSNGLKGLLYYKVAVANRNNINLLIDAEKDITKKLSKLSEKELNIICKLVGIYFDNAIEEAMLTRKKILTFEVYSLKNTIEMVITNSTRANKDVDKLKKKGTTSKGENRGQGLYFADKIVKRNSWLNEMTIIKDGFYIQRLTIIK